MALTEPFIWGSGGARLTPEEIARERELALALQQNDFSPVGHWSQGAARVLNSLGGVLREKRADQASAANSEADAALISALLGGGSAPASGVSAPGAQLSAAPAQGGAQPFSGSQQEFVNMLLPEAMKASEQTGVDPRIIIAQAAQESGWGKSAPGNNFFGIKSHGAPGGQTLATNEVVNGQTVPTQASFRTYDSPQASVQGYADFITSNPRYQGLRQAQGLDAQLQALGQSDYATDPNYAASVGQIARGINLPQQPVRVASADGADFGPVAQALAQSQPRAQPPNPVAQALAQAPQQPQRPQINPAIMEALTSPYASREAKAIAQTMLQQQMQAQQQANDPRRRMELEKLELETERLRNPQAPDAIRTLQARAEAAGLAPGTPQYQAFMLSGGAAPVPQVGSIPAGYQLQYDDQGRPVSAVPIPGTPQAMEAEAAARSRATVQDRKSTSTDVIGDAAQRARELTGWSTTGMVGSLASNASSSQAAELRRQVDVMKSIATIENLTAMRMASPTGGALGNVTEKEGAMLASATGALDAAASEADFKRALDNYEKTLYRVVHGTEAGDKLFEERRKAAGGQSRTSSGINWSVEP